MKIFNVILIFLIICTTNIYANDHDLNKKKTTLKELKAKLKSLKSTKAASADISKMKANNVPAMSKKEAKALKKAKIKEIKKAIQNANNKNTGILLVILTVILPPLAVGLVFDIGQEFWISLLLTLLFYIPGLIYSLIKIFT